MRSITGNVCVVLGGLLLAGCVVREEPPPHRVYVYDNPPPAPVEVVPVTPEPGLIWVQGVYVREGGGWAWHHGYWRR